MVQNETPHYKASGYLKRCSPLYAFCAQSNVGSRSIMRWAVQHVLPSHAYIEALQKHAFWKAYWYTLESMLKQKNKWVVWGFCLHVEQVVKRLHYFTAVYMERCLKGSNTTMVIHVQLAFQSSTSLQHVEAWQSSMGYYCLVIWKNEHGKPFMFNLHVFIFSRLQYFFLIFLFYSLSLSLFL